MKKKHRMQEDDITRGITIASFDKNIILHILRYMDWLSLFRMMRVSWFFKEHLDGSNLLEQACLRGLDSFLSGCIRVGTVEEADPDCINNLQNGVDCLCRNPDMETHDNGRATAYMASQQRGPQRVNPKPGYCRKIFLVPQRNMDMRTWVSSPDPALRCRCVSNRTRTVRRLWGLTCNQGTSYGFKGGITFSTFVSNARRFDNISMFQELVKQVIDVGCRASLPNHREEALPGYYMYGGWPLFFLFADVAGLSKGARERAMNIIRDRESI